ncbi:MAG TPA: DUF4238 domain-containing protein, partial [Pyrinomonadaceae bacterium]|nr:DUF4238 domain-containing protein [Pyrinomonadaceae bacterium]
HLTLAWFIAFLANRTPWARQRLINLDKAVWVKRIKAVCRDVPLFEIVMKEKEPDKSPEELEKSRQALLNDFDKNVILTHTGDCVDDSFLERAFHLSETLSSVLLMKNWMLLECPTSQVFVTSDNPVILLPPPGYFDGMNVSFMNAPVLFPISPKRALLLSHLKGIGVVRVWGRQMKEMVDQTITYGHKAVFSNIASEEFQEIFDSVPEGDTTKAYSEQRN